MPDYQKMYHALFNDVSDAITKLQQSQQKTEEMYMNSPETILTQIPGGGKKEAETLEKKPPQPKKKPPFHNER